MNRMRAALSGLALMLTAPGCTGGDAAASASETARVVPVTVAGAGGRHVFRAEPARTEAEQQRGLMYRTDLGDESAMLFAPYPPVGGAREASFWMKNTPTPLDIIFIRPDGTIARIAENTVPFSEAPVPSGEPVSAVLEIKGGRAAELGIAEGDRVTWPR